MTQTKKETKKRDYHKPRLNVYGSVKDFTKTLSHGGKTDGGAFPQDKMHCISATPMIEEHRVLLDDGNCQEAFKTKIHNMVKEGDVVLDLGCGTAIHSMMAIDAGAKKVYAIEIDNLIEFAKEVVRDNGYADKIEFFQGDSLFIDLPEKVDHIICNLGFLNTIQSLPDAVKRFLKPGGSSLPDAMELFFVPVSFHDYYEDKIDFWKKDHFGYNFSAFRKMAANHPMYLHFDEERFLSDPSGLGKIHLSGDLSKHLHWSTEFDVKEDSLCNGLAGWYNFYHDNDLLITTKPPLNMHKELWSELFLPLDTPLSLQAGEKISCKISMYQEITNMGPVWRWQLFRDGKCISDQSSFDSMGISEDIIKRSVQ